MNWKKSSARCGTGEGHRQRLVDAEARRFSKAGDVLTLGGCELRVEEWTARAWRG